jgi:peptide/nickel transport system substrate-binding protein
VTAHVSWRIYELVYSNLVRLDPNVEVQPELAESWSVSDDGTTWTFNLRQDVKFHNGQDMTAEDVKYTYERILDEETGAIARSLFAGINSIDTPDPYTVVFTLETPNAAFLTNLANQSACIVSEAVVSSGDPALPENTVGTGPYKLSEWEPDNYMILERHPDFFIEGQPIIDTIRINIIPTEDGVLAAMRAGEADFAIIEDVRVAKLAREEEDLVLLSTPSLNYELLFVNGAREPLNDVRVRQAIGLALDRQQIIDGAALGEGEPTGPFPPSLSLYALPLSELFGYERDIQRAQELLAEAGYPDGFSFTMMTQTTEPANAPDIAQIVQAQLREVNIDMEIELVEWGQWLERWKQADFDMCPGHNSGSPDPDYYYYRYMHTGESLNFVTSYSNPEADELLEEGRATFDLEERVPIYQELEKILAEELPFIWLYVGYEYRLLQPYVTDFAPMPNGSIMYLREVNIEK